MAEQNNGKFDGRIGEKMESVVKNLCRRVYQSKNQMATSVGPHGSSQYGYQTVDRCRHRGFCEVDADHDEANVKGKGALVLTERGARFAREELGVEEIKVDV